jgi:transposase
MRPLGVDKAMRERLRELSRSPDAGWWVRDRVEMVLLAAEGWSAPLIAHHLGCSDKTVRRVLAAFRSTGVDALDRKLRGPAPDFNKQQHVHAALGSLLEQQRTWTSGQLARALENHGVHIGPRQVRRYLASMGANWRRTKMSLAHKQREQDVARARRQLSRLKKTLALSG